ncbi:MAG: polysaccharide deacetylase family protein [Deltaproteobacteria bacterium]|nr:polysaccharide deacetylase family protein [Deltaproteobacteria bacterium]
MNLWLAILIFLPPFLYLGLPALVKMYLKYCFLSQAQKSNCIYLTFDDGPNPEATPILLDILRDNGAKATFFVTGKMAEQFPDIVARICAEGHTLGGHSYAHCHPWKTGPWASYQDMARGTAIMRNYLQSGGKILFRPPYGKFNLVTLCYIVITGQKAIFWNNDVKDYLANDAADVCYKINEQIEKGNRLILLHDGGSPTAWKERLRVTAIAVGMLFGILDRKYVFNNTSKIQD